MGKIAIDYDLFLSLALSTLKQIEKEVDAYYKNEDKDEKDKIFWSNKVPWGKYKRIAEKIFDLTDEKLLSNVDPYHFMMNKSTWLRVRDMAKVLYKDIEMIEDELKTVENELLID